MYFVHPQLKLNKENIVKILKSFAVSPDIKSLQERLSFLFPKKQFVFTDMGRTAFRLIIEKLDLRNSQMLLPAYICDVFYPTLKEFNITPLFLDIDPATFNINPEEIKQKINPGVKSILISHTYGLANDMAKIRQILHNYQLQTTNYITVIEDFAHTFGAKQNGKYLGNFGDVSFCSLYKQFPCLRGGLAVFQNQKSKIKNQKILLKTYFNFRDFISLLNYFSFFSFLFKKFGNKIAPRFLRTEKRQQVSGLNDVSLNLFSLFFDDFEKNLEKRKAAATYFQKELSQLGFAAQRTENNIFTFLSVLAPENLANKRDELVKELRKRKVFCTRIWHTPIILNEQVQKEYSVNPEQFPQTITAAKRIINLPLQSHYTKKDVDKMIRALKFSLDKIRA